MFKSSVQIRGKLLQYLLRRRYVSFVKQRTDQTIGLNTERTSDETTKPSRKLLFEDQFDPQLLKELPVFRGTTKLITILTTAGHLSLPWKRKIQTLFKLCYFLRTILILNFHLCFPFKFSFFLRTILILHFHLRFPFKLSCFLRTILILHFHIRFPFKLSCFLRSILILHFHLRPFFNVGSLLQTDPHKTFLSIPRHAYTRVTP